MSHNEINPPPTIGRSSIETQYLIKFLTEAKIGDVFTYQQLNAAAKCDVQARNTVLQTAKRNLAKPPHRMVFGTIMGVGIKRLSDEEIPEVGVSAAKRSGKIARKGMKMLDCAEPANMTAETKVRYFTTKTVLGLFGASGSRKTLHLAEQSARNSNGTMNIGDIAKLFNK